MDMRKINSLAGAIICVLLISAFVSCKSSKPVNSNDAKQQLDSDKRQFERTFDEVTK
jgi:hypothetical protein